MKDAIIFWAAKDVAELLMVLGVLAAVIGTFAGLAGLQALTNYLNAWVDRKKRNEP